MDTLQKINDSVRAFDPYSLFINYLWNNFLSNPFFWMQILILLFLILVARVFYFDNKKFDVTANNMAYPGMILLSCIVSVIIAECTKTTPFFPFSRFVLEGFITLAALFICYGLFGHKLIKWSSSKLNFKYSGQDDLLTEPKP